MRKLLIAAALAVPSLAAAQQAAQSPHTFTGNISLVSDYRFRGIAQTFEKPALQGGVDYSHSSGIYLGNWNSNVNEGAGYPSGNLEMDFYGGWKKSLGDFGLDIGAIYYYYPGTDANNANGTAAAFTNPRTGQTHTGKVDNKELYIGASWKWLSAKWFYALDDYFSLAGTKGTQYLDISATYDLGGGWGVNGHVGRLKAKGWHAGTYASDIDYTDWKVGVTKDVSGWVFGVAYVDTNAKGDCAQGGFYCFGNQAPFANSTGTKDAGKGTLVLSVGKTF
jgi:uncharacterized protein (TIGR02001 family)